ncbi:toll/interleukin-1 receptor domain-containing protein [Agromyces atrinae]|uniref:Toll/interleukin-1 receptor domain-containing protein n=1 Tax=Agromyces atrinae TaxID=592376 RepID=A0A4Q2M3B4_9MICO|nr:toll/interleukin-1 receptor domain-containing protein [Agromyces atrinae]NYD66121.1 hypothetical protein [Agromyces atrinae]RXZ86465.1 toll/interleukin-1 receptor domain-containing protein [Agromyces atrinae]
MSEDAELEVQGFISYNRADNAGFANVVDQIKTDLEQRFHASTGRRLKIFLDRESIGWGADWRASISGSVKGATFFIPIVSQRYFESPACKEELLLFHENAKNLGVTRLILPIVLTGAERISPEDDREEVQIVEQLNYKNVEPAWLAGYDSAEWRRAIYEMVKHLEEALQLAETHLAEQESAIATVVGLGEPDDDDVVVADSLELSKDIERLTELTGQIPGVMTDFTSAATAAANGIEGKTLTTTQKQAAAVRLAHDLKTPALNLEQLGREFEATAVSTDARLRAVAEELRSLNLASAEDQLERTLAELRSIEGLRAVVSQFEEPIQQLRYVATANVSIRKSVQPAINGFQAISSAISTIDSWKTV